MTSGDDAVPHRYGGVRIFIANQGIIHGVSITVTFLSVSDGVSNGVTLNRYPGLAFYLGD